MFILRVVDCSIAYYTNIIPAFNPKTLRIAELRKILIFHEIDFVTGAKKGDLVEAFQRGIVPQRAKLLLEVTDPHRPLQRVVATLFRTPALHPVLGVEVD